MSELLQRKKIIACPLCGKYFEGPDMLKAHRRIDHTER